jgi:hypothetical protein
VHEWLFLRSHATLPTPSRTGGRVSHRQRVPSGAHLPRRRVLSIVHLPAVHELRRERHMYRSSDEHSRQYRYNVQRHAKLQRFRPMPGRPGRRVPRRGLRLGKLRRRRVLQRFVVPRVSQLRLRRPM